MRLLLFCILLISLTIKCYIIRNLVCNRLLLLSGTNGWSSLLKFIKVLLFFKLLSVFKLLTNFVFCLFKLMITYLSKTPLNQYFIWRAVWRAVSLPPIQLLLNKMTLVFKLALTILYLPLLILSVLDTKLLIHFWKFCVRIYRVIKIFSCMQLQCCQWLSWRWLSLTWLHISILLVLVSWLLDVGLVCTVLQALLNQVII